MNYVSATRHVGGPSSALLEGAFSKVSAASYRCRVGPLRSLRRQKRRWTPSGINGEMRLPPPSPCNDLHMWKPTRLCRDVCARLSEVSMLMAQSIALRKFEPSWTVSIWVQRTVMARVQHSRSSTDNGCSISSKKPSHG